MDQLLQCPVCTLYLHNGMSLESHLDTHPKDQVIKALCSLSGSRSSYGSRESTPMHSERSYKSSRSRTPATDDSQVRWNSPQIGPDHDRFWRKTPSRTPKSSTLTRNDIPDLRDFDTSSINNGDTVFQGSVRSDKTPQPYIPDIPGTDYEHQFSSYQEQSEEKEIKYSRSAEYSSINNTASNVFTYNVPSSAACVKFQNTMLTTPSRKNNNMLNALPINKKNDLVKICPKGAGNLALLKTNMGSVQYITPGVMVTAGPFVQKPSNNLIMTGNIQTPPPLVQSKTMPPPLSSSQFSQLATSFIPNTTVVTQNSQIIYREMVHNIDGKPFIPTVPAMLNGHETVSNVAQTSSLYQNVMVVDQYGNTSCMYASPQTMQLPKPPSTSMYNQNMATSIDKSLYDPNKTLVIEVGPIAPPTVDVCKASTSTSLPSKTELRSVETPRQVTEKPETPDSAGSTKGLKILSNIKVEVPVQHHKNLLNTVVDLTGPVECDYPEPESTIKEQFQYDGDKPSSNCHYKASSSTYTHQTFSVIKNVGKTPSYKELKPNDKKLHETESSDSCPVPDLICNEKPSISPCSELSDNGDNATDNTSIAPKPESSQINVECNIKEPKKESTLPPRISKNYPLRLNFYVKKHKKILQIKNSKENKPSTSTSSDTMKIEPSSSRLPEDFTITKIHHSNEKSEKIVEVGRLETVSIDKIDHQDEFDADTEEQSMDLETETVTPTNYESPSQFASSIDLTQVKEEANSSNEEAYSNQTGISERELTKLESMRPHNMVHYGNMPEGFDDDSNHNELLDLEAASKNKQFVSMMNDNYFGDNIYADYFTPDRVESFDTIRESGNYGKDLQKDGVYLWGESSQKVPEYVLPTFIHENYKIAQSSHGNYTLSGGAVLEVEAHDGDSKADLMSEDSEPTLNICTDEMMPPRGEISGQESNGDMEASWNGIYQDVTPSEPYDLIARESWVSDGSEVDINEKRETLEEELKPRLHGCSTCGLQFPHIKELRVHQVSEHPPPSSSALEVDKKPYRDGLVVTRVIKKEKTEEGMLAGILQDTKAGITPALLNVYDVIAETKPQIDFSVIKKEPKKRRKDYVCPTCKIDQLTDALFHEHLKIHPLECLTCGKCFFRRVNLAQHYKMHTGVRNYKCEICEKRFLTRQKLIEHHNMHSGRAPIKCTHCDHTFKRYSNMVQHRNRAHLNKKPKVRDYVCHCGEVFHSPAKLQWHKETHDGKPKACQYCSDKFVHAASLTRHVRRSHNAFYLRNDVARKHENVPCPVCKQIYLRTNLKTHMLTHSGKRPHFCVICNKAFSTPWNLKLHRWTHMSRSAKPFKCHLCKSAFIRKTEYISHMNAHKSVRPYTCNYCGCQFIRKYNCQRHVREHEMAKKYVCKVPDCGKTFHRGYYLSEHMKVHSGARPFSCNICGKTSSNKSNHNKHVKIHHAREPVATEA